MKKSFSPRNDGEVRLWMDNFSAKLPTYAERYGISPNEVADTAAAARIVNWWLDYQNKVVQYSKNVTQYKKELLYGSASGTASMGMPAPLDMAGLPGTTMPGALTRAMSIGHRIKAHVAYNLADGADLGLEGAEKSGGYQEVRPDISLRLVAGGHPEIVWRKAGMTAIELYKMDADGNWAFLAIDTVPNYVDNSSLPPAGKAEVWHYRAIYRLKDELHGDYSDVVKITVSGM